MLLDCCSPVVMARIFTRKRDFPTRVSGSRNGGSSVSRNFNGTLVAPVTLFVAHAFVPAGLNNRFRTFWQTNKREGGRGGGGKQTTFYLPDVLPIRKSLIFGQISVFLVGMGPRPGTTSYNLCSSILRGTTRYSTQCNKLGKNSYR